MHDVDVFRIQANTDGRALCAVIGGLDQPLEALEFHDDIVVQALEGDAGDTANQMTLFRIYNVNVLGKKL